MPAPKKAAHQLTTGERLIFATAWAVEFQKQMADQKPRDCIGFTDEAVASRARWEAGNADRATEIAASAVLYIREAAARALQVQCDRTAAMLKSMLA